MFYCIAILLSYYIIFYYLDEFIIWQCISSYSAGFSFSNYEVNSYCTIILLMTATLVLTDPNKNYSFDRR